MRDFKLTSKRRVYLFAGMCLALSLAIPNTAPAAIIANSIAEFSGIQGQDGWFYGYYDRHNDADSTYNASSDFQQMTNFGVNWYVHATDYWTSLTSSGGHPNGPVTTQRLPEEQWSIRRWVADVSENVNISGSVWNSDEGVSGDGITAHIFVDGVDVWSHAIAATDSVGVSFSLDAAVNIGSTVDLAINPNASDFQDSTVFFAEVSVATGLGNLSVYDHSQGICPSPDLCGETGPLFESFTPEHGKIEAIRNEIELYVQGEFSRNGWNGAGGALEVYIDSCTTGSIRCDNYQTARIFLQRETTINPFDEDPNDETLDVIAHEYFHGLLEAEEVWYFDLDSISVSESLCDIFAVAIDKVPEDKDSNAWIMGELSTLQTPRNFEDKFTISADGNSGDPYIKASIHNHAAYYWTENYLAGDREIMAKVFYDASRYLPPFGSDFSMLRIAALEAARIRGLSQSAIQGLEAAYDRVEIKGRIDPAWVDFSNQGARIGSEELPFNAVNGGVSHLRDNGTLKIQSGNYNEAITISQPMRIEAVGGLVRIGTSGARATSDEGSKSGFMSRN